MHALGAPEQLTADACVTHITILENGPRHGDRLLGVVSRFADAPLVLRIADIARNRCARRSLESTHSVGIPSKDTLTRQRLGLLPDRITNGKPLQTGQDPLLDCWLHLTTQPTPPSRDPRPPGRPSA